MEQALRTGAGQPFRTYLNPLAMLRSLAGHRDLIWQLTKRDLASRYRATRLGFLWSILTPLILLAVYTFVFAVVFKARWTDDPHAAESRGEFALTMFCGMLLFGLFSEVVNRASTLIVNYPNYVKKVVFPLETFVLSALGGALINMLIGYGVWLLGWAWIKGAWPPATIAWFPLVVLPVCLTTAGVAWVLASLGVFVRDVGYAVGLIVQVLFFATPIFYSIERVPPPYRLLLEINPLTHAVEDARRVLMKGLPPEWGWWYISVAASAALAVGGYAFFMKSKRAFADVI